MVWSTLSVRVTLSACLVCFLSILTQWKVRDYHEVTIEANTLRDATPHTPAKPAAATFRVPIPMINTTGSSKTLVNVRQNTRRNTSEFFFGGGGAGLTAPPQWARASSLARFLDHIQRRNTVGRTSLDEWKARRGDLCLATHNSHDRQISMPTVGFEITISAGERQQTYALDHAATGPGSEECILRFNRLI